MKAIVEQIISKIGKGSAFDSHFIIAKIIKEHSDEYLLFASQNIGSSKITEHVHSKIAQYISSFDGAIVKKLSDKSLSNNIRGNESLCALWEKK